MIQWRTAAEDMKISTTTQKQRERLERNGAKPKASEDERDSQEIEAKQRSKGRRACTSEQSGVGFSGLPKNGGRAEIFWERGEATKQAETFMQSMEVEAKRSLLRRGQAKKSTWRMPWH